MSVVCVGISHHTAPVAVRESVAWTDAGQRDLYAGLDLQEFSERSGLGEIAILSTCNRTEIYGATKSFDHDVTTPPAELISLLTTRDGVESADAATSIYGRSGTEAVRHLCRVAAGLDSMVIGETEILGQVQEAHDRAVDGGVAGPILDEVFRTALRSGRRARSETGICRTPVSVASEAIRVAAELAGPLTDRNILILGTGRMGRVVGRVLTNKGAGNISVVSRTRQHAESLARVCRAKALPWHKLSMAVSQAEVVFATTGAPHAVVTKELVESTLDERPRDKPLVFIDIAVPRDVDPEVGSLRLVSLIDIDAIKDGIGGNLAQRENELPRAEHIVGEEVMRFEQWYREAQLRPLLGALRMQIERIRRNQIERLLNGLDDVTPELRDQLDKFSRSLVTKILHEPTVRLKRESDPKQSALYSEAISRLFGLPQELRNEDTS